MAVGGVLMVSMVIWFARLLSPSSISILLSINIHASYFYS